MEMGEAGVQKEIVILTCDLPHPKEVAAAETIRFTLNGSAFELDTCAGDAKKMRATMAPFIGVARQEVKAKPKPQARAGRSRSTPRSYVSGLRRMACRSAREGASRLGLERPMQPTRPTSPLSALP